MFQAYVVTCLSTGKRYVGITQRLLRRRWYEHALDAATRPGQNPLRRAIAKHGESQFTIEPIFCAFTHADLCAAEIALIAQWDTLVPHGYNLSLGGEGAFGCTRSPEHRAAISRARSGKPRSAITRAKLSIARRGKSQNVGAANPGAKLTPGDVRWARSRLATGETQRSVARALGVSFTAIWRIANGLKWRSVA